MAEKLQRLLAERGLTQAAFEPMVGLPENRISKWAGGQGEPTGRQFLRMARYLGVPVEYLIDDEIDQPLQAGLTLEQRMVLRAMEAFGFEETWRRLHPEMGGDRAQFSAKTTRASGDDEPNL